jgi:hypothetical protein
MQSRGYFSKEEEVGFGIKISFKDLELVYLRSFEMNKQQTYKGPSVNAGWMRDLQ